MRLSLIVEIWSMFFFWIEYTMFCIKWSNFQKGRCDSYCSFGERIFLKFSYVNILVCMVKEGYIHHMFKKVFLIFLVKVSVIMKRGTFLVFLDKDDSHAGERNVHHFLFEDFSHSAERSFPRFSWKDFRHSAEGNVLCFLFKDFSHSGERNVPRFLCKNFSHSRERNVPKLVSWNLRKFLKFSFEIRHFLSKFCYFD